MWSTNCGGWINWRASFLAADPADQNKFDKVKEITYSYNVRRRKLNMNKTFAISNCDLRKHVELKSNKNYDCWI